MGVFFSGASKGGLVNAAAKGKQGRATRGPRRQRQGGKWLGQQRLGRRRRRREEARAHGEGMGMPSQTRAQEGARGCATLGTLGTLGSCEAVDAHRHHAPANGCIVHGVDRSVGRLLVREANDAKAPAAAGGQAGTENSVCVREHLCAGGEGEEAQEAPACWQAWQAGRPAGTAGYTAAGTRPLQHSVRMQRLWRQQAHRERPRLSNTTSARSISPQSLKASFSCCHVQSHGKLWTTTCRKEGGQGGGRGQEW